MKSNNKKKTNILDNECNICNTYKSVSFYMYFKTYGNTVLYRVVNIEKNTFSKKYIFTGIILGFIDQNGILEEISIKRKHSNSIYYNELPYCEFEYKNAVKNLTESNKMRFKI